MPNKQTAPTWDDTSPEPPTWDNTSDLAGNAQVANVPGGRPGMQFTPDSQNPEQIGRGADMKLFGREMLSSAEAFGAKAANASVFGMLPKIAGAAAKGSGIMQKLNPDLTPEQIGEKYKSETQKFIAEKSADYPIAATVGEFYGFTKGASKALWEGSAKLAAKAFAKSKSKQFIATGIAGGAVSGGIQAASEDAPTMSDIAYGAGAGGAIGGTMGGAAVGAMLGAGKAMGAVASVPKHIAIGLEKMFGGEDLRLLLKDPAELSAIYKEGTAKQAYSAAKTQLVGRVQDMVGRWKNVMGNASAGLDASIGKFGEQVDTEIGKAASEVLKAAQSQSATAQREMQYATSRLVESVGKAKAAPNIFWENEITPLIATQGNNKVNVAPVLDDIRKTFLDLKWIQPVSEPVNARIIYSVPTTLDPAFQKNAQAIAKVLNKTGPNVSFNELQGVVREVANFANFDRDATMQTYPMRQAWEALRSALGQASPQIDKKISEYAASRQIIDPIASALFVNRTTGSNEAAAQQWLNAVAKNPYDGRATKLLKLSAHAAVAPGNIGTQLKSTDVAIRTALQKTNKIIQMQNIRPGAVGAIRKQMVNALLETDPAAVEGWAKVEKLYNAQQSTQKVQELLASQKEIPDLLKRALVDDATLAKVEGFVTQNAPGAKRDLAIYRLARAQLNQHYKTLGADATDAKIGQYIEQGLSQEDANTIKFVRGLLDTPERKVVDKLWNRAMFATKASEFDKLKAMSGIIGSGIGISAGYYAGAGATGGSKTGGFAGAAAGLAFMRALNNPTKVAAALHEAGVARSLAEATKRATIIQRLLPKAQMLMQKLSSKGAEYGQQQ